MTPRLSHRDDTLLARLAANGAYLTPRLSYRDNTLLALLAVNGA